MNIKDHKKYFLMKPHQIFVENEIEGLPFWYDIDSYGLYRSDNLPMFDMDDKLIYNICRELSKIPALLTVNSCIGSQVHASRNEYLLMGAKPKGYEPSVQFTAIDRIDLYIEQKFLDRYKNKLPHQMFFKMLFKEAENRASFDFISCNANSGRDPIKKISPVIKIKEEVPGKIIKSWEYLLDLTKKFNSNHEY